MSATHTTRCPECSHVLYLPSEDYFGMAGRCPSCGHKFVMEFVEIEPTDIQKPENNPLNQAPPAQEPDPEPETEVPEPPSDDEASVNLLDYDDVEEESKVLELEQKSALTAPAPELFSESGGENWWPPTDVNPPPDFPPTGMDSDELPSQDFFEDWTAPTNDSTHASPVSRPLRNEKPPANGKTSHPNEPHPALTPPRSKSSESTKRVGHFELLEPLGKGAFGTVYKAHDTNLDRIVALKIPHAKYLDPYEIEKFVREAQAAAQLRHPNIVGVHEVGREEDCLFIVSDFVDGIDLAEWMKTNRASFDWAARLCGKVAGALHHAHLERVIHRDLKPANLMLDFAGEPHILDFGLAKRDQAETTLTAEGDVFGTPAYMSPEQARGEAGQADRRSDIYSLGVILYELLTGEKPFRGSVAMMLAQVLEEEPPTPRKLNAAIPKDLETICLKCLEKDPARRYATAKELQEDLGRYLRREPVLARPLGRIARGWRWCHRKPFTAGLSFVTLVSLVAGTVLSSYFGYQAYQSAQVAMEQKEAAEEESRKQKELVREKDLLVQSEAKQRREADRQRLAAFRPQIRQNVATGWKWYDNGDATGALLKFTEAFRLASLGRQSLDSQPDADESLKETWTRLESLNRMRVENLLQNYPLEQLWLDAREACLSDDGTRAATVGPDNTLRIWDVASGVTMNTFSPIGDEQIFRVLLSRTGAYGLTLSDDQTARVWYAARDDQPLAELKHDSPIRLAAFGPRSQNQHGDDTIPTIIISTADGAIHCWTPNINQPAGDWQECDRWTDQDHVLALDSQGTRAIVTQGQLVYLLNLQQQPGRSKPLTLGKKPLKAGEVTAAEFSGDGLRFALALGHEANSLLAANVPPVAIKSNLAIPTEVAPDVPTDPEVHLWDIDALESPVNESPLDHTADVTLLRLSRSGQHVLCGLANQSATVWTVGPTISDRLDLPTPAPILDADFDHTESFLALGCGLDLLEKPGELRIWNLQTRREIASPLNHTRAVTTVAFAKNSSRVLAAGGGRSFGETRLWDVKRMLVHSWPLQNSSPFGHVIFAPDNRWILEYDSPHLAGFNSFRAWRADDGIDRKMPEEFQKTWGQLRLTPKEETVNIEREALTRTGQKQSRIIMSTTTRFETATIKVGPGELSKEQLESLQEAADMLPDSALLTGMFDVLLIDLKRVVTQLHRTEPEWEQTPPPRNEIRVWELATGKPLTRVMEQTGPVSSALLSDGGQFLATTDYLGRVRVWSLESSEPLTPPLESTTKLMPVALSADGHYLVTSAMTQTETGWEADKSEGLRVWDLGLASKRSPQQIEQLAAAISSRRLDASGDGVPLDTRELGSMWELAQTVHPPADAGHREEWHARKIADGMAMGYWKPVLWHLDHLLENSPSEKQTHWREQRAIALAELGRYDEAKAEWQIVLKTESDDLHAQAALVAVQKQLGETPDAETLHAHLKNADHTHPDFTLGWRAMLLTEHITDNPFSTDPVTEDDYFNRAAAHFRAGEDPKVLTVLNECFLRHVNASAEDFLPSESPEQFGYRPYSAGTYSQAIPRAWCLMAAAHDRLSRDISRDDLPLSLDRHAELARKWKAEVSRFSMDLADPEFRSLDAVPVPRWVRELPWHRRVEFFQWEATIGESSPPGGTTLRADERPH